MPVFFSISAEAQDRAPITHRYINDFEDSLQHASWMNPATVAADTGVLKNHFSRIVKTSPYSSGIETTIPEDLSKKNFRIDVKGLVKVSGINSNIQLVIAIDANDSAVYWKGTHIADSSTTINKWHPFQISTLIPRNTPVDSRIKIFVWNADGTSEAGIDNLEIVFTEVYFPSFLPRL
jgi:hypothetical protein